jgi:hypothetical protein
VVVVAFLVSLLVLLLMVLAPGWFRLRGSGRQPVAVESTDEAWQDARSLLDNVRGWLARTVRRTASLVHADPVADARAAYRALLRWARRHGIERSSSETVQELQARLAARVPTASEHLRTLSQAYARDRYGGQRASQEEVARLRASLAALDERSHTAEA